MIYVFSHFRTELNWKFSERKISETVTVAGLRVCVVIRQTLAMDKLDIELEAEH